MKNRRTLRQMLVILAIVTVIIPFSIFALASQIQVWYTAGQNLNRKVSGDLAKINQAMDMILDKYQSILYSFCTDDDMIALVKQIEGEDKETSGGRRRRMIRRQLMHICNRNEGIEGVTLITSGGEVYFYDRLMASSVTSSWAGELSALHGVKEGAHFHGGEAVRSGAEEIHLIQIYRRLVDYQDINRDMGVVILSINENVFHQAVSLQKGAVAFVCEDDRVVIAEDDTLIGSSIHEIIKNDRQASSYVNDTSGWTLYYYQSRREYWSFIFYQSLLWLAMSAITVAGLIYLLRKATKPLLDAVDGLVDAMNRVEKGDFAIRVAEDLNAETEIHRITAGFNRMAGRLEESVEQVRQAMTEQKNAELSAMEAQIDPHFLYNTLDTINWKAIEQEQYEISGMVGDLADILRYSIRNPGETVSVGQELSWLQQYLHLQSARLEKDLDIQISVPRDLEGSRIHKLLLQPFVENSIKHGFSETQKVCQIRIRMKRSGQQIHITISDNGRGIPPAVLRQLNDREGQLKNHVGIMNVRKRLNLYYGEEAAVYFESKENLYTRVHMFVPLIDKEMDSE